MHPTFSPSLIKTKVPSIALILHSSEHELFLTAPGERRLSLRSMVNDEAVRNFFSGIVADTLASTSADGLKSVVPFIYIWIKMHFWWGNFSDIQFLELVTWPHSSVTVCGASLKLALHIDYYAIFLATCSPTNANNPAVKPDPQIIQSIMSWVITKGLLSFSLGSGM